MSRVQLFVTPGTAAHQDSLSITNSQSLFKLMFIESVRPSNHLILCRPLLLPTIFPALGSLPMSQFFPSGGQSIGASSSASVLLVNPKGKQFRLVGSPCSPRDSQRIFNTTFKSFSSSVFSFFYSRTLTSIHDYWKNHSLD